MFCNPRFVSPVAIRFSLVDCGARRGRERGRACGELQETSERSAEARPAECELACSACEGRRSSEYRLSGRQFLDPHDPLIRIESEATLDPRDGLVRILVGPDGVL